MIPKHQTQAFLTGPGSIELRRLPMPDPDPGELLIRVDAATVCGTDVKVYLRGGHPTMLALPSPFGHEVAGTVVRAAAGAPHAEGDAVVVANSAPCGECRPCRHKHENLCRNLVYLNGAFADYLLIPEAMARRSVHPRPAGLDPAVAALAEPLACAVHCLERCLGAWSGPPTEARTLVIGCGPLGLMLIDLFHDAGAHVRALDPHRRRLDAARLFGAAETSLGRAGDGAGPAAEDSFDFAIDATGTPAGWDRAVKSLAPGGVAALFGGCRPGTDLAIDAERVHYREQTLLGVYHHRPSSFGAALDRLVGAPERYGTLVERELPLDRLTEALDLMIGRRALKVAIRPRADQEFGPETRPGRGARTR